MVPYVSLRKYTIALVSWMDVVTGEERGLGKAVGRDVARISKIHNFSAWPWLRVFKFVSRVRVQ